MSSARSVRTGQHWTAPLDSAGRPSEYKCERRPLDEISLVETGNAMAVVAEQTGGITAEELKRETLGLFGGRRMTAGIEARLGAALDRAVANGVLVVSESGLIRSGRPMS